jgi:hypothetical protein
MGFPPWVGQVVGGVDRTLGARSRSDGRYTYELTEGQSRGSAGEEALAALVTRDAMKLPS